MSKKLSQRKHCIDHSEQNYEPAQRSAPLMPPKYPAPFLSRRSDLRPVSQATEIFDTDFESDYEDEFDYSDESPRRSVSPNAVIA